jgi:hypothetical protein
MNCVDMPLLVGYILSVAIILGFPFIYLSARSLGRAFESGEGIIKASTSLVIRLFASIALTALFFYFMDIVPITLC